MIRLARPRRPREPTIALINIVFLMLIFFMVAGQISKSDAAFVSPPESISEAYVDDDALQILLDADKQLWLNDEQIALEDLDAPLLMLCGPGGHHITGVVLPVDGGHLVKGI